LSIRLLAPSIAWDPVKAVTNVQNHGITFADAATVLMDELSLTREDPDAQSEQRFVTLGMSAVGSLLVVVFTHRDPDTYRIISAWKANKQQRRPYESKRR
jgi:uncharacterized protein